ncbi:polysaccharide deacetylase family protein [Haladaptatus cibarius]|uniref:polysaccharide deacetylase family protein n=1 Tax=Haladaptatus cibarius TaxID=453847 RepID=UPI0006786565|nr:polysaccharide deacetylase family protein [Haladaptatus cibarius]
MDNKPVKTPRRRFLSLAGATALLAGCTSETPRSVTETTTEETSTGGTTSETTINPKPTLRTKYNSRKRYGSPGTSFDTFENPDLWEAQSGEKTPDTEIKRTGSQSLRLTSGDNRHVILQRRLDEPMDFTNRDISAMIRTTTPSKIGFYIYLYDTAGNHAVLELRDLTYREPDIGWFRTCPGVFKTSETEPDLTNIDRMKLQVTNATSDDVEAWVDDLRLHLKPEKGYIILSWDDGARSYYAHGAQVHDEYGFPAVLTHPPRPAAVEEDYFMSLDELHERQSKGDEIAAHGSVDEPFGEISASKLDGILRRNKRWLLDNEFGGANFIVYPGNNFDKTALNVISKYHYMGGMNQSGNVNTTGVYGFDPLVLPRTVAHDLEISKRVVDNVAKYRNCGILNFHHFERENTMSAADYKKLLAHIDSTSGVEVVTFSDLWRMRTDTTA